MIYGLYSVYTIRYLKLINKDQKQKSKITCDASGRFKIDGGPQLLEEKTFGKCKLNTRGTPQVTHKKCVNGAGDLIKIGYSLNPLLELYRVCYDTTKSAAMYTIHTINGESLHSKMSGNDRYFRHEGSGFPSISDMYEKTNQRKRFQEIFGSTGQAYLDTSYLERGHMTPYADFAMSTWQYTTNYYINVYPQWEKINNGNWGRIEDMVRDHAKKTNRNYKVFTGNHELLTLEYKEIYLYFGGRHGDHRIPVPKWSWKVVIDGAANSGIAFLTLNNPHVQPDVPINNLCPNICATSNWQHRSFSNRGQGYTICCNVNDIKTVITSIPPEAAAQNVMRRVL